MKSSIPLLTHEARIKRELRAHLRRLGFFKNNEGHLVPPNGSKECFRNLHLAQRQEKLVRESNFIKIEWPRLKKYFANGEEINPIKISPRLEFVKPDSWQSRLFRLASLTWSVPVSQGYGRRMRFLVWDNYNGKLMGLIALGDPVFNMRVRDDLVGWSAAERKRRLVNILDAYVLGAIPPYNMLLGGKLISCLIRTKEIRDVFVKRYSGSLGIISGKRKHASLVLVTTSSALGKSSVYNRLTLNGCQYFEPIGYTSGWGHFHIPEKLFHMLRLYLKAKKHKYSSNNRFGDGPNWRLRAIRHALTLLNLNPNILRHGISREVFICKLASNAINVLTGEAKKARYKGLLSVKEVGQSAIHRWVLPRSYRRPEYLTWNRENLYESLLSGCLPLCPSRLKASEVA